MADEEEIDPRVTYIQGRKKYHRPSGMLWSENTGTLKNGLYVPNGYEIGVDPESVEDQSLLDQFLLITDDNRQPLDFSEERIEKRERIAYKPNRLIIFDAVPSGAVSAFIMLLPAFCSTFPTLLLFDARDASVKKPTLGATPI